MSDPLERLVRDGLVRAGLSFKEDSFDTRNLDFMLSDSKIYIEIKQFHSERISEQMSRAPNVIAIQGVEAAKFFAGLLSLLEGASAAVCVHTGRAPMTDDRKFTGGHKTINTGDRDEHGMPIYRHEPLSAAEAETIWESCRRAHEDRVARMPDEKSALNAMHDAYTRLKDMGWRDAIYCPKDGGTFEIIEVGSTGIFRAHYQGEWPTGSWWAEDAGDLWPSRPALFRLLPEAQAEYDAKMAAARERWRAEHAVGAVSSPGESNG